MQREVGNRSGEPTALINLSGFYLDGGDPRKSLCMVNDALSIARENGNEDQEALCLNNIGNAYLELGDPRRAPKPRGDAMDYLEMEFPADAQEERVRSGRNMSDVESWISLAAGIGLAAYGVTRRRSSGWLLAGVGGLLIEQGATGRCRLYDALGINTAGTGEDTRRALGGQAGVVVEESVEINRPVEELYHFWRNLENIPRFMHHLESVERITDTLSRWRANGPAGTVVEWNAEIINEVRNKLIGWRSIEGSDVVSAGSVRFQDLGPERGTCVRVRLQYSPPGGKVGAALARLMGADAATEIREDLRRFKMLVESPATPS